MKILHVTDAAAGGVLSSVTTLARSQAADPRFEHVAVRYTPRTDSPAHEDIRRAMGPGVDVSHWSQRPRGALRGLAWGLLREIRGDWDVIHLHSSRAGFLGRAFAIVLPTRAHRAYSPHGFAFNQIEFSDTAMRLFRVLERLALHGGRDLVLVSPGESQVAARQLPGARTAVLPNAVDTLSILPTAGRATGADELRDGAAGPSADVDGPRTSADRPIEVVHIGRITTQKRPELFAQIAARAQTRHPGEFAFTWIGDGDRSRLGPCPTITITGWLSPERIRDRLSHASLLLFTSAGEGMSMSLLEAASMGIPAIGSNVIGVRDLIEHGVDGMLFDTVDEAVAALDDLSAGEPRRRLAAAARARVVRDHSQTDLAERSWRIYCEFLAPRPAADPVPHPTPAAVAHISPRLNGENSTVPLTVTNTGSRSA